MGFYSALYAFVPKIYFKMGLPVAPLFITSEFRNHAFLKHYQDAEFEKHDFTIRRIVGGETRVMNWWTEANKADVTEQERHVVVTAREGYGIRNGVSLPLIGVAGFGGVSVMSKDKDSDFQMLMEKELSTLMLCTQIFHEHVMSTPALRAFFIDVLLERLSAKERRLLPFLIKGLPMKALPTHIPDISQKYGEKLLENILEKFGGINKAQLLYHLGLLQLLGHL